MGVSKEQRYLDSILAKIDTARAKNKPGIYLMNAKIPDNTAKFLVRYFTGSYAYEVDAKKCMSCKGTWDIMITFKKL